MDNRFEMIRQLGAGGQGRVFLVRDHARKGILVALKRLSDKGSRQGSPALEFERLAQLRHPNLARAYDFGEDDEGVYFTSEFIDGRPIHEWAKTVSQKEIVRALGALLRAISLLHDRDLVHGDISSKNVLVQCKSDETSHTLKLLDLGEARKPGQTGGGITAGFTAPEILKGRGALPTSDLYALGALSAEVLLGSGPFGTGDASTLVQRQLNGEIQLPKAELSPIAALCRDLLQSDPSERPQTAGEVLRRLSEAAETDLAFDFSDLTAEDLPSPRLIQREKELAALFDFIEQMDDEAGFRTAAVEGPRGSGRSALLEEAARFAQLSGIGVIGHAKVRADAEHLLSSLCLACKEKELSSASRKALAPWTETASEESSTVVDMSQVVFAALEALISVSQNEPKLLLVDDFFLSDKITREVVFALARSLSAGRSGRPRAAILLSLETAEKERMEGLCPTIASLQPLDNSGISQLAASMFPGIVVPKEFFDAVFLSSSGLPKTAEEIVRQSVGTKSRTLTNLASVKLRDLDPDEQLLIAVMGAVDDAIPEFVLLKTGISEDTIAKLVRQGFCIETVTLGASSLTAARLAGVAALQLVDKDAYLKLAEAFAMTLQAEGLFRHAGVLWRRIDRVEPAHAAFCALAEERLRQGDILGAAEWFEVALNLWDKQFDISRTAQKAVETWQAVGWFEQAQQAVPWTGLDAQTSLLLNAELTMEQGRHREALSLLSEIDSAPLRPLKHASLKAACEMQLARHERALSLVLDSLSTVDKKKPSAEAAQLAQIGGLCCTYLGQTDRAETLFQESEAGFTSLGDALGRLKVLGNMGMLYCRKGDLAEARRLYDNATALAISLCDKPREGLHRMNRGTVAQTACNYQDAYDDYMAALEIAEVLGNGFRTAQVEVNLADLLIDMGQGAQAAKMATRALKRCRAMSQERLEARALLAAGRASRVNGDFIRAEQRLLEAQRRFSAAGDESGRVFAQIRIAELMLDRQDFIRAEKSALEAAEATQKKGRLREHARALIIASRCIAEAGGALDTALLRLEAAENAIKREASPETLMQIALLRSRILEKLGRHAERQIAIDLARTVFGTLIDKVPSAFKAGFTEHLHAPELAGPSSSEIVEPSDRWARDLEMLMEINRELTSERDPKRLLFLIMESAVNLTGAERGMLVMPKVGGLEPVISHQISEEVDKSFSRSVAEKVVLEGRAVLAVDALGDERFRAFVSVNALKLRSILAVPLKIKRRVVGAVYLDSRLQTGVFSDADRRLLEAFGAQAAVCLETARLISENQEQCRALLQANEEIKTLSDKLQDKLEKNEAKLVRVGALLEKTQQSESEKLKEGGMAGRSPAMQRIRKLIDRIATANVPVYIFGASGTGKELAARAIHSQSERKSKPFIAVNCGALPSKLLAGELFGHKKGAFTGAVADRPGLFKIADKGTLFLDEVSDMDKEMQTHLLRVLQDGTFRSLGDNEEISVDVRILAASNRDLENEVKAGRFREDLFYRLNVVRIDIPPLSERREDIPLLIESLVKRHGKGGPLKFTREAVDLLMTADWPGNVRELENEVLRAMTMASDNSAVAPADLSPRFTSGNKNDTLGRSGTLKDRVAYFEEMTIRRTTAECGGNASKAARSLGISRATLYKKLEKSPTLG